MKKRLVLFFAVVFLTDSNLYCEKSLQLNLKKAVHTGLKNNRELIFKGKENIITEKNLNLKYRNYFPDLKISYSDSASVAYYNPDSHTKKVSLSLTQDIYDKGRKKNEINLGKKQLSLEKLKINDAEEDYTFQVISSFKEILKLDMELSILRETFNNTSLQLQIGNKEMELGEITQLTLLEMEIAYNNIELLLEKKKSEKGKNLFSFSRLLTLKADIEPEIIGKINTNYTGFITEETDFYIDAARKRSTSYREKLLDRESAYENFKTTSRENIPDVKADCGFSMSGQEIPLTEPGLDISLTFSLDKPGLPSSVTAGIIKEKNERSRTMTAETSPFSSLVNIYSKESSRLILDKTLWEIEKFKLSNEFNIKEMLLGIKSLKKELILLRRKLNVQKRKIKIEKLQLKLGEIKRIDYMESSIELSQEKINLVNSVASLYQKEISLLRLCGINNIISTAKQFILNDEKENHENN